MLQNIISNHPLIIQFSLEYARWFISELWVHWGTFFVNFFSQIPFPKSHFPRSFWFWKMWFLFSPFPLVYHHWNHSSRVKCDSPFPFHICQMWNGKQTWIVKRNLRKMCPWGSVGSLSVSLNGGSNLIASICSQVHECNKGVYVFHILFVLPLHQKWHMDMRFQRQFVISLPIAPISTDQPRRSPSSGHLFRHVLYSTYFCGDPRRCSHKYHKSTRTEGKATVRWSRASEPQFFSLL